MYRVIQMCVCVPETPRRWLIVSKLWKWVNISLLYIWWYAAIINTYIFCTYRLCEFIRIVKAMFNIPINWLLIMNWILCLCFPLIDWIYPDYTNKWMIFPSNAEGRWWKIIRILGAAFAKCNFCLDNNGSAMHWARLATKWRCYFVWYMRNVSTLFLLWRG